MSGRPGGGLGQDERPEGDERLRKDQRVEEGERTGQDKRPGQDERIGPLTIARHVKDDGRALILYTRDAQTRT